MLEKLEPPTALEADTVVSVQGSWSIRLCLCRRFAQEGGDIIGEAGWWAVTLVAAMGAAVVARAVARSTPLRPAFSRTLRRSDRSTDRSTVWSTVWSTLAPWCWWCFRCAWLGRTGLAAAIAARLRGALGPVAIGRIAANVLAWCAITATITGIFARRHTARLGTVADRAIGGQARPTGHVGLVADRAGGGYRTRRLAPWWTAVTPAFRRLLAWLLLIA